MGYTRVRHYEGGLADWLAHGLPAEGENFSAPYALPGEKRAGRRTETRLLDAFAACSIGRLLALWGAITLGFGCGYWALGSAGVHGLLRAGAPLDPGLAGLADAVYFSFVTSLTIGYGDVVPVGGVRAVALLQGASGFLLFGAVIAKLVSRRQESLTEELHEIAFEEQLGRVRVNLHFVLTELQALGELQAMDRPPRERIVPRLESAATVFHGELRTVHRLLYRPRRPPDEETMESILAMLYAVLRELAEQRAQQPGFRAATPLLARSLEASGGLARAICAECVPREFAPRLREWMDRVSAQARSIEGA